MKYTELENTPIVVDLLDQARDTGWSVDGNIATHEPCNNGNITLRNYPLTPGHTYEISYSVLSIASGSVQLFAGITGGQVRTTTGLYIENIIATGTNPVIKYFSNGACQIQEFNIRDTISNTSNKQQNTLCFSAINQKWSDFRTFSPDLGFSLFIHTYTLYHGDLYEHANNSDSRNNFYGTQYSSILKFVENQNRAIVNTFQSINYQSNQLLITTTDGITTSLGQISELSEIDFVKDFLSDNVSAVEVYDKEGIFAAGFLRDKNTDLLNGDVLKGNYCIVELITTENTSLKLFTVEVVTKKSYIGSR